ncbi:hypothetical protein [Diaphorobacter aerolatus]|nr:hypothetical protein [Diaphorobacter aerolatus]
MPARRVSTSALRETIAKSGPGLITASVVIVITVSHSFMRAPSIL